MNKHELSGLCWYGNQVFPSKLLCVCSWQIPRYYVYCCQKPSLPDPVEGVEGEAGSAEGSGSAASSATGEEAPAE